MKLYMMDITQWEQLRKEANEDEKPEEVMNGKLSKNVVWCAHQKR